MSIIYYRRRASFAGSAKAFRARRERERLRRKYIYNRSRYIGVMHNGCAFGRRQRAVFARPLYARAVKRINTLLTPRNRRSGLFPRVFFFLSSTPLVTYRCLRILLANLSTLCFARYIKARESSDALKNSTLPLPLFIVFARRVYLSTRERRQ